MKSEVEMRTAAWYGDRPVRLSFPANWDVTVAWPQTPPELRDDQIAEALERPAGQAPLRDLCKGKSQPLVIIDDLTRPTPVNRLMPFLLRHFRDAGISPVSVRILVATGTHEPPRKDALLRKVGPEAASECRVLIHDPNRGLVSLGRTSFGTPVIVNKEVAQSDFVVGIGGIYPNHSAGFGGGSKLVLGVLGRRPIMHLHYRHKVVGWGSDSVANSFRRDVDEIARMTRISTMICLHVNCNRELVRIACGDYNLFYSYELAFSQEAFSAPLPAGADLVVANSYPSDVSLTFVHKKGTTPLRKCADGVSRIVVGSCSEGAGQHGLFPFVNRPAFYRQRQLVGRISVMTAREVTSRIAARLHRRFHREESAADPIPQKSRKPNPVWLYRPGVKSEPLPSRIPEMRLGRSWPEILDAIKEEQQGRQNLKVLVYPCAPLQVFDQSAASPQWPIATTVGSDTER